MGCASLPPCPAKGGPAWRELTSDHFVLRTDLSPREALETVRTLEDTRAAMLAGMWAGAAGPPGKSTAIALASLDETWGFTGTNFAGVHLRRPPFPATLLISPDPKQQDPAKHELAHELALYFLPVQPSWFAEGLATFLATIQYDRDKGLAVLGEAAVERYRRFTASGPVSLDQLMGPLPDDPLTVSRYYATTWLLTHYLYNNRGPGWQHLQDRLARLQPGTDAFRAEFPDLDAEGLQRTLMDYAKRGQYVVRTLPVAPWSGTPRIPDDDRRRSSRSARVSLLVDAPGQPGDDRRRHPERDRREPPRGSTRVGRAGHGFLRPRHRVSEHASRPGGAGHAGASRPLDGMGDVRRRADPARARTRE